MTVGSDLVCHKGRKMLHDGHIAKCYTNQSIKQLNGILLGITPVVALSLNALGIDWKIEEGVTKIWRRLVVR